MGVRGHPVLLPLGPWTPHHGAGLEPSCCALSKWVAHRAMGSKERGAQRQGERLGTKGGG